MKLLYRHLFETYCSKRKTYKKAGQGKKIQCSWSVDWQRGKHSVRKIFTLGFCIWRSRDEVLALRQNKIITWYLLYRRHSRPQRPRSFWSAPRIATSGRPLARSETGSPRFTDFPSLYTCSESCLTGKSDWFWSQSIVFTNPFKTGMSLDLARGSARGEPEVAILGADQKERGLWGRECAEGWKSQ